MVNADPVSAVVRATPLVGLSALGLGPFPASDSGSWLGVASAGVVGGNLLVLTCVLGGSLTPEQLRDQTVDGDPAVIEAELARMVDAGLLSVTADGTHRLDPEAVPHVAPGTASLADPQAATSEELQAMCRRHGIAAPPRKQERIDAIAAHFAQPDTAELARKQLSPQARALLLRIVTIAGPYALGTFRAGVSDSHFYQLTHRHYRRPGPEEATNPLLELVEHGFVGVNQWERTVWVWREAVPALGVPLIADWSAAPRPEPVPAATAPAQVPEIVSILNRALRHWAQSPPPTLKNREPRLGKAVVASTAKALGTDTASVELVARLAIETGLLLTNTVAVTGRGKNRRAEQVWMADPDLAAVWDEAPAADQWARLVAAWCRPERVNEHRQLLCNRHLALWELCNLEPGVGYPDDEAFAAWVGDRHASLGHPDAVAEVVADIRALGLAPATGPLALSGLARHLLDDPATVATALDPTGTSVVVQGDLTILVPPDTDPTIRHRLADLAVVESDGGAQVLRLDETRITRAVQDGATAEDIVAFLRQVSSVPLVDAVTRLVADAAARSQRVSLQSAATVVVVVDPADLILACSVKGAKLEAVSDTVAVSPLPLDKVRAALDRKGLAPTLAGGQPAAGGAGSDPSLPAPRSAHSAEAVEQLRRQAETTRRLASRSGNKEMTRYAQRLEQTADQLADPRNRLVVTGPLTITPSQTANLFKRDRARG